jgi:hypothetical protein
MPFCLGLNSEAHEAVLPLRLARVEIKTSFEFGVLNF